MSKVKNAVVTTETKTAETITIESVKLSISEKITERAKGIITIMSRKKGGLIASHSDIQSESVMDTLEIAKLFSHNEESLAKLLHQVMEFLILPCDEKSLEVIEYSFLSNCLERVIDAEKKGKLFIKKPNRDTPTDKRYLAHALWLEWQSAAQKSRKAAKNAAMLF